MRFMIISDDNIVYDAHSNIQAFIIGGLLNLGARGKELNDLSETIENIYLKGEGIDLGNIVDYVFEHKDRLEMLSSRDWLNEIVKEQW